jgi:hypothetical protein
VFHCKDASIIKSKQRESGKIQFASIQSCDGREENPIAINKGCALSSLRCLCVAVTYVYHTFVSKQLSTALNEVLVASFCLRVMRNDETK